MGLTPSGATNDRNRMDGGEVGNLGSTPTPTPFYWTSGGLSPAVIRYGVTYSYTLANGMKGTTNATFAVVRPNVTVTTTTVAGSDTYNNSTGVYPDYPNYWLLSCGVPDNFLTNPCIKFQAAPTPTGSFFQWVQIIEPSTVKIIEENGTTTTINEATGLDTEYPYGVRLGLIYS
jgi:hypothetical protein